jgi:hypothetical protein
MAKMVVGTAEVLAVQAEQLAVMTEEQLARSHRFCQ